MAAELLLKVYTKLKPLFAEPRILWSRKTKGLTNSLIFENLKNGKEPKVFLKDTVLRTLSLPLMPAAMAIGLIPMDKPGTYLDDNRFTYKQFITERTAISEK
jgi:hypothetical protein